MIALHAIEELDARALHPEDSDAIADLRPFGFEIGFDEFVRQLAALELGTFGVNPIDGSLTRKSDRAGQDQRLVREIAKMLCRLVAIPRLVEQTVPDADHGI